MPEELPEVEPYLALGEEVQTNEFVRLRAGICGLLPYDALLTGATPILIVRSVRSSPKRFYPLQGWAETKAKDERDQPIEVELTFPTTYIPHGSYRVRDLYWLGNHPAGDTPWAQVDAESLLSLRRTGFRIGQRMVTDTPVDLNAEVDPNAKS